MNPAPIPEDVRRFILLAIPSVPYLEALLLMRRAQERTWDAFQIAQRLYLSEKAAAGLLRALAAAGLVDPEPHTGSFRYRPESEQLTELVDRLALTYSKNLVGVSELIHSKFSKKAQQFVDAFVFRRES
jgi:DNA-binding IclR family transcriptional regulator